MRTFRLVGVSRSLSEEVGRERYVETGDTVSYDDTDPIENRRADQLAADPAWEEVGGSVADALSNLQPPPLPPDGPPPLDTEPLH